jgi:hypothetical protein
VKDGENGKNRKEYPEVKVGERAVQFVPGLIRHDRRDSEFQMINPGPDWPD